MSVSAKAARWLIVTCGLVLIAFLLAEKGILLHLHEMDTTFISIGILVAFVISHFFILYAIKQHSPELEDRLWYVAESLISVGMVGTVVGFTMVFGDAFIGLDINDPDTVTELLVTLGSGVGTALITTLTGLVSSLILKGELVFLVGEHDE